jgi:hypothetical protein
MAYETKALIVAIFNHVKGMSGDEDTILNILQYLQQVANADSVILELPRKQASK